MSHRSKDHNDHQQVGWQPALFWCVFCPCISFTYTALPLVVLHCHMNHRIVTLLQFCFGFRGGCAKIHKFLRHALYPRCSLQTRIASSGGHWRWWGLAWDWPWVMLLGIDFFFGQEVGNQCVRNLQIQDETNRFQHGCFQKKGYPQNGWFIMV